MPECIINRAIELYHLKSNCKTVEEMWNKFWTDNYFVGELTWKEVSMFDVEIMNKYWVNHFSRGIATT